MKNPALIYSISTIYSYSNKTIEWPLSTSKVSQKNFYDLQYQAITFYNTLF